MAQGSVDARDCNGALAIFSLDFHEEIFDVESSVQIASWRKQNFKHKEKQCVYSQPGTARDVTLSWQHRLSSS